MPCWLKGTKNHYFWSKMGHFWSFLVKMGHFGVFGTKVRYHPWRVISKARIHWEMLISDPIVSLEPLGVILALGHFEKRTQSLLTNNGEMSKSRFFFSFLKIFWVASPWLVGKLRARFVKNATFLTKNGIFGVQMAISPDNPKGYLRVISEVSKMTKKPQKCHFWPKSAGKHLFLGQNATF